MKRTVAIISGAMVLACVGTAMAQTDDFQCFKAKDTAKAFVKTSKTVTDTFNGSQLVEFKKVFLLCDSAQIAGGPARTVPTARLSCFKVKAPKLPSALTKTVTDDFSTPTRAESIQKVFVVCDTATAP